MNLFYKIFQQNLYCTCTIEVRLNGKIYILYSKTYIAQDIAKQLRAVHDFTNETQLCTYLII